MEFIKIVILIDTYCFVMVECGYWLIVIWVKGLEIMRRWGIKINVLLGEECLR
jgi:hypothetical protein